MITHTVWVEQRKARFGFINSYSNGKTAFTLNAIEMILHTYMHTSDCTLDPVAGRSILRFVRPKSRENTKGLWHPTLPRQVY